MLLLPHDGVEELAELMAAKSNLTPSEDHPHFANSQLFQQMVDFIKSW